MVPAAPRTDVRVIRFVRRLERRSQLIADVARATGVYCDAIGVTRPSYEQVRLLFHAAREQRMRRRAALELLVDVHLKARPPSDLLHLLDDPRGAPRRGRRVS